MSDTFRHHDHDHRLPETKQQFVRRVLRQEIQDGTLKPGQPLPISEVAARFGVSTIPVREAIGQLAQESLVRVRPHATPVVRGVSIDEAIWTAELRTVLEPIAAREAVGRIPDAVIEQLDALAHDMERSLRSEDLATYLGQNRVFHESIYEHCVNRMMHAMLVELWETGHRFQRVYQSREHIRVSQREHHDMVLALRRSDADAMQSLVRRHRERNTAHLLEFLDQDGAGKLGSDDDWELVTVP